MPVEIFCCYARKDRQFLDELKTHLIPFQWQGQITLWADTNINAGVEWEEEIKKHLDRAKIILLLVSPDFIASEYCYSEMKRAMELHETGEATVIPVILRLVDWKESPFGKLQALPTNGKPVTGWTDKDTAYYDIAQGIRKVVEKKNGNTLGKQVLLRKGLNSPMVSDRIIWFGLLLLAIILLLTLINTLVFMFLLFHH